MTSEVAEEALLSVFVTRPEVLDVVDLDGKRPQTWVRINLMSDEWWKEMTPEKAFLARVYGEHLRSTNVSREPKTNLTIE